MEQTKPKKSKSKDKAANCKKVCLKGHLGDC